MDLRLQELEHFARRFFSFALATALLNEEAGNVARAVIAIPKVATAALDLATHAVVAQTRVDEREGLSVAIAGNAIANAFRTPA
jgi:hypothetical protein